MSDDDRSGVAGRVARYAREAGRQYAAARRAYREGRAAGDASDTGAVRIVCRRHADRREVAVEDGRPACFEADHPDCEGCAADLHDGCVETW
ncbi:MAG: hypothetical protein ABEJ70_08125 [Halobacteriaceae archaeon]